MGSMRRQVARVLRRSKRNVAVSVCLVACGSVVLWCDVWGRLQPAAGASCPFERGNFSFPSLDRRSRLPSRSIFFHSTSCAGNLTSRERCAVESAAATHPGWQVNVVFSGPTMYVENETRKTLRNVKFWRIRIEEISKGTPFEDLMERAPRGKCSRSVVTRDVLKYMTLGAWGGIYLDLDMIVSRPLATLARNWATRDTEDSIGEAAMAFSRDAIGRNISEMAIKEMDRMLRAGCGGERPTVMSNVLRQACSTAQPAYMSAATCNGFEVYGAQFFHPVPEVRARDYFLPRELAASSAYTYHLWGHVTKQYKLMRTSPFAKLAKRFCPLTFKMYSDQL